MPAKIIAVFNQKGGCAKTLASMQIGGTLGIRGKKVLVVDMDTQGTASVWSDHAPDDNPFPATVVHFAQYGDKFHMEVKDNMDKYDYIIIDCPPAIESPVPSVALLIADLAIISTLPASGEHWAMQAAKKLALTSQFTNSDLKIRILISQRTRTSLANVVIQTMEEEQKDGIPIMKTSLYDRTAYKVAQAIGTTVHYVAGAKKAIEEVDAMVDEVVKLLKRK